MRNIASLDDIFDHIEMTNALSGRTNDWRPLLDLFIGAGLLLAPRPLRWSARSRRLLSLSGVLLLGSSLPSRLFGRAGRGSIARVSEAAIGATLLGGQYLLSEEDSSVRGSIALVGGLLMVLALPGRKRSRVRGSYGDDVIDCR
jgi:hypothetical protein